MTDDRSPQIAGPPDADSAAPQMETPGARPADPRWRRCAVQAAFSAGAIAIACYIQLVITTISDPDAFYHLAHARLYAQATPPYAAGSPLMAHFPWAAFSVVSRYAADLWYGFHLLLIPFTYLGDPRWQIKGAGIFELVVALHLLWWALRRLELPYAWLWVLAMAVAAPLTLWRLSMTRPHVLSTALCVLLLSFLVRGRWWQVGLISLAVAFVHLTFFWAPVMIAAIYAVTAWWMRREASWAKLLAIAGGLIAGFLLRPNPLGAAQLLYVQTVVLTAVRGQQVPLSFGAELDRISGDLLLRQYYAVLALWLVAAAALVYAACTRRTRATAEQRILLWSAFIPSLVFFAQMTLMSKRAVDLWDPFALTLTAAAFPVFFQPRPGDPPLWAPRTTRRLIMAGVALLIAACAGSLNQAPTGIVAGGRPAAPRLKGVGEWLRDNAPSGALVVNVDWVDFPQLLYWNPRNRYIGGMDPIFQYAFDHRLYWEVAHLADRGKLLGTSGAARCTPANAEDIYTVLRRDFDASYIVLDRYRTAGLYAYVTAHPRFAVTYVATRYEDPTYGPTQRVIAAVLPPLE